MAVFWITNRVANPVLRRLLRTPAGRVLGRRLAVLRYTGRRTGRPHELICTYVRDGATVWVLVARPERKVWWRNLRAPAEIELWLAGEHAQARAVALEGSERPEECATGLAVYLAAVPQARRPLGLSAGADETAVAEAARRAVVVRADLTSDRPAA
jgi:F420H(2)-dependent quinone reductase